MKHNKNTIALPLLAMPRVVKRISVLILDASLCILTTWLAFYLRLGEFIALSGASLVVAVTSIVIALPIFIRFGLYRAIFRYSGWPALMAVAKSILLYGIIFSACFTAIGFKGIPRTVGLIQPILLLLTVGASRSFARFWLGGIYQNELAYADRPKVLIYGAGKTGRQLALAMANSHKMQVVGFLDDDTTLHGHFLNAQPIYNPHNLKEIVRLLNIGHVLLALPSISRKRRNDILQNIRNAHVSVRTLPSLIDLAQGKFEFSDIKELDIEDLLGRDLVQPDPLLLKKLITDKIVLVTGAGGSIGSELCRQIWALNPKQLLLVEQSEFSLYSIHQELENARPNNTEQLIPLLASVQHQERIEEIISTWQPDTIYHAAAYKHVPLVEHNVIQGLENNVMGTWVLAKMAHQYQVKHFVLISTDKAVRPTNIMGASKRLAEMVLQAYAENTTETCFSMVRFGNVLGSSGSVVPKFRQQIQEKGVITLTHPDITRYFMTIPEAAELVIQAGAMAKGGDVFVLDMGEPVKIMDLAEKMVELSGLTLKNEQNPEGDIEIIITGLRPGEKLFEELLIGNDPDSTSHPKIMKAQEEYLPWTELSTRLAQLENACAQKDRTAIYRLLEKTVSGYQPETTIVDWVYAETHQTDKASDDALI